ncbi:hypothetical protein F4678DRAFT_288352 [Xylaria arbuscula]|nr:hypothetical protein F4678DRAFT_288352 [Xylaria arbuscula]
MEPIIHPLTALTCKDMTIVLRTLVDHPRVAVLEQSSQPRCIVKPYTININHMRRMATAALQPAMAYPSAHILVVSHSISDITKSLRNCHMIRSMTVEMAILIFCFGCSLNRIFNALDKTGMPRLRMSRVTPIGPHQRINVLFLTWPKKGVINMVLSIWQGHTHRGWMEHAGADIWHHDPIRVPWIPPDDKSTWQSAINRTRTMAQHLSFWTKPTFYPFRRAFKVIERVFNGVSEYTRSLYQCMTGSLGFQLAKLQSIAFKTFTHVPYDIQPSGFVSTLRLEDGSFFGRTKAIVRLCGHFLDVNYVVRQSLFSIAGMIKYYPITSSIGLDGVQAVASDPKQIISGLYLFSQYARSLWYNHVSGASADDSGAHPTPLSYFLGQWNLNHIISVGKLDPSPRGIAHSSAFTTTLLYSGIYSDEPGGKGVAPLVQTTVIQYIKGGLWGNIGGYTWNYAVPNIWGICVFDEQGLSHREVEKALHDDDGCKCPGGPCPPGQGCRAALK